VEQKNEEKKKIPDEYRNLHSPKGLLGNNTNTVFDPLSPSELP